MRSMHYNLSELVEHTTWISLLGAFQGLCDYRDRGRIRCPVTYLPVLLFRRVGNVIRNYP